MSLDTLRDGSWLTLGRMRLWVSAVLIASAVGIVFLFATAHGLNDYQGRPLGTDFSNIYVAGTLALHGRPEAPFDVDALHAQAQALFGADTPTYRWHYPPLFHFVAAALAAMPYLVSLAVWQGVTLIFFLLTIRAIVRAQASALADTAMVPDRLVLLLALAFPAVFVNIGHGHNGLLTASLIGSALLVIERRPILAGVLFGLVAYKPQFGLMIPLVLLATGRWRTIFAATATVVATALAVALVFGTETWRAFIDFSLVSRSMVENGDAGWPLIQSPFGAMRMLHAPLSFAYAVQGAITLGVAAALVWLWRSPADFALKAAALCIGTMLSTPYCLDYDMLVLGPAIAFLAVHGLRRGFAAYEITALSALWLVPLIARSVAKVSLIPLGAIVMLVMFVLVIRRARADLAEAAHPAAMSVPAE